jgi:hypothetical protein
MWVEQTEEGRRKSGEEHLEVLHRLFIFRHCFLHSKDARMSHVSRVKSGTTSETGM